MHRSLHKLTATVIAALANHFEGMNDMLQHLGSWPAKSAWLHLRWSSQH
jgi:hypothetical protein